MVERSDGIRVGVPRKTERARLSEILSLSFQAPAEFWETWYDRVGRENLRVARQGGEVVAGLGVIRFGQWWHGRLVPAGGIAGVGVLPEARGRGVATALVEGVLAELRETGTPLALLYASTQRVYRKAGFEQAGTTIGWRVPLAGLPVGSRALPVRRVDPKDVARLAPIRRRWLMVGAGRLQRPDGFWAGLHPLGEKVYAYEFGPAEAPEGYLHFHQMRLPDGGYDLKAADLVALTPAARERIWTFLADHRSLARHIRWRGGPDDANLLVLPEQTVRCDEWIRWMLRVTDVPAALAARGWPKGVGGEVHFEIRDEQIPENGGRFRLTVAGGRAEIERGGEGRLRLSIGDLAPLYTGLFTPPALHRLGRIEGDPAFASAADPLFAGPPPSLADRF